MNGFGMVGKQDKWHTGSEAKVCESCSWVGEEGYIIALHPEVLSVAFYLCKEIKTEWQMLLSGSVVDRKVNCTGYYIPKQEVTYSTVKNLEAIDKEFIESHEIVATIHSHSDMGVFFSPVDDEFTNMNWIKHHVVINNKHDFVAKSRHDLPCSGVKFVNSVVETMVPSIDTVEGQDKITKHEYKYPAVSGFDTRDAFGAYDDKYVGKDYTPGSGYWENGVWRSWNEDKPQHDFYGVRGQYKKVNGVWKQESTAY